MVGSVDSSLVPDLARFWQLWQKKNAKESYGGAAVGDDGGGGGGDGGGEQNPKNLKQSYTLQTFNTAQIVCVCVRE